MSAVEIIFGLLLIIVSAIIIVLVLLQESSQGGLSGAIAGGSSDTFFGKNKGRTKEAQMARITKFAGIALFALVFATYLTLAYLY